MLLAYLEAVRDIDPLEKDRAALAEVFAKTLLARMRSGDAESQPHWKIGQAPDIEWTAFEVHLDEARVGMSRSNFGRRKSATFAFSVVHDGELLASASTTDADSRIGALYAAVLAGHPARVVNGLAELHTELTARPRRVDWALRTQEEWLSDIVTAVEASAHVITTPECQWLRDTNGYRLSADCGTSLMLDDSEPGHVTLRVWAAGEFVLHRRPLSNSRIYDRVRIAHAAHRAEMVTRVTADLDGLG